MKVLFFAQCRDAAARADFFLAADGPLTQADFWTKLLESIPALVPHRKTARLARNEAYLRDDELLHPGDEIALIPPVSGG